MTRASKARSVPKMASMVSAAEMSATLASRVALHGREHPDGRHALRAVDEGESFLGLEHQGLEAAPPEGLDRREALALRAGPHPRR